MNRLLLLENRKSAYFCCPRMTDQGNIDRVFAEGRDIAVRARILRAFENEGGISVIIRIYDRWDLGWKQITVPAEKCFAPALPSIDRLTARLLDR